MWVYIYIYATHYVGDIQIGFEDVAFLLARLVFALHFYGIVVEARASEPHVS